MNIIDEAYLRANSIDAVRGLAYRNGHIRESEELNRARMMIFKLINYIKKLESEDKLKDLSKRVENIEKQMKEDKEEQLKKLQAELDYAKFHHALNIVKVGKNERLLK